MRREKERKHQSLQGRLVMGRNCVLEVLKHHPERVQQLFLGPVQGRRIKELSELAAANDIQIESRSNDELTSLAGSDSHQGVAASVQGDSRIGLKEFLRSKAEHASALVIALNGIEDPHNVGAILRACECFGVDAVLMSSNRGAQVGPVVSKVSVGASELVPQIIVSNVAESLLHFEEDGWWLLGADVGEGAKPLKRSDYPGKAVIVLGAEGEGIQPLIQKRLNGRIFIPMYGKIDSLNVSQAAAVVLALWRNEDEGKENHGQVR